MKLSENKTPTAFVKRVRNKWGVLDYTYHSHITTRLMLKEILLNLRTPDPRDPLAQLKGYGLKVDRDHFRRITGHGDEITFDHLKRYLVEFRSAIYNETETMYRYLDYDEWKGFLGNKKRLVNIEELKGLDKDNVLVCGNIEQIKQVESIIGTTNSIVTNIETMTYEKRFEIIRHSLTLNIKTVIVLGILSNVTFVDRDKITPVDLVPNILKLASLIGEERLLIYND